MQKAKNDDKLKRGDDRFNPNVAFLMIVLCFGVMFFFRLDEFIGAVGLWQYYAVLGALTATVLTLFTLGFADRWLLPNPNYKYAMYGFGHLYWSGLPIIIVTISLAALVMLFTNIQFYLIDNGIFLASVTFTSVIWIISHQFAFKLHHAILKFITFLMLTFTIAFTINVMGTGTRPTYVDETTYESNLYYVYRQPIWLSQESTQPILLYECNSFGLYCELVHIHQIENIYEKFEVSIFSEDSVYLVIEDEVVYRLSDED